MSRTIKVALLVVAFVAFAPACEWDYLIWIPRSPDADPLYRFRKGDHMGYIDGTGKVVVPPSIKSFGGNGEDEFHDGRLEISVGNGVYIDTAGKKVIDKGLYRGWDFSEGLASAEKTDRGPWGYINTSGDFVISPRFASGPDDYVWPFSAGLAKIETNGRFGYIDHSGNFVIAPKLLDGDSFHDGFARVVVEGPCAYARREAGCPSISLPGVPSGKPANGEALPRCKFTFIDKTGRVISDQRYDYALGFSEGLAPVLVNERWGYIDKTGELVITPRFDNAAPFSDGVALVRVNNLYGYIDSRGFYVIPPRFKWAESFVDGRAVVGSNGEDGSVWYIDHYGNQAFSRKFAVGSSFFKGLAHVKLLPQGRSDLVERFEYIDRDGRTVFAYTP
jgi:hypothetical protein